MNNQEFITAVFGPTPSGEYLWAANFATDPSKANGEWKGSPIGGTLEDRPARNTYFSVARLRQANGQVSRRKDNFASLHCVVVDDAAIDVCSWQIETSAGNYQTGFILDAPITDLALATRIHEALANAGKVSNDQSGNNPVRYVRLPIGSNTKYSPPFPHRLSKWIEGRKFSLDEIVALLGLDAAYIKGGAGTRQERSGAPNAGADGTTIIEGGRNAALTSYAGTLRRQGMSVNVIRTALLEENAARCRPPLSEREVEVIAASVARYDPPPPGGAPQFDIPGGLLLPAEGFTTVTASAEMIFAAAAEQKKLFLRGDLVVEVRDGAIRIIKVADFPTVVEGLGSLHRWMSVGTGRNREVALRNVAHLKGSYVQELLAKGASCGIDKIQQVIRYPALVEHDGQLMRHQVGWNDDGTIVLEDIDVPEVDFSVAKDALIDLIKDFKFLTEGDHARCIALMLTPALVAGRFHWGHTPLGFIEADDSQTGKTLLSRMISALYGATLHQIGQSRGGVGSLDEQIKMSLVGGYQFISFDNFRGKFDSSFLELVLTATGAGIVCRVPGGASPTIDPRGSFFTMTSNGVIITGDLANRTCPVRIVKQPEDYPFRDTPEQTINARLGFYMGCVQAIIRGWVEDGKKTRTATGYDFREWAGKVEYIVTDLLGLPSIVTEYKTFKRRVSSPTESLVRKLINLFSAGPEAGQWLTASHIASVAMEHELMPPASSTEEERMRAQEVGRVMAAVFPKLKAKEGAEVIDPSDDHPGLYRCSIWDGDQGRYSREFAFGKLPDEEPPIDF